MSRPVAGSPLLGHVLAAPDKFRGTASARQIAEAVGRGARRHGLDTVMQPMADGGEGTVEVIGEPNRSTEVTGPLGVPVRAPWTLDDGLAVLEMAQASGLLLAGGAAGNDPLGATTTGTGELISAAIAAGARSVVVGLGGSATTDGGLGAVKALWPHARLRETDITVITDVNTKFLDAARGFGPQKGATPSQVALLERRLARLAEEYASQFGIDVREVPGSGAAGGLAGGLVAIGASIAMGFDYLAELVELPEQIEAASLVVTGEGCLDEQSSNGKVVGGVVDLAQRSGVPVLVLAGVVSDEADKQPPFDSTTVVSLVGRFGEEAALLDTVACIEQVVHEQLLLLAN